MEIIRRIWPGESPFKTPRQELLRELQRQAGEGREDLRFLSYTDARAQFPYFLQLPASATGSAIGTSTLLAAWNASTYVAQIDDDRLRQSMGERDYLEVTSQVLQKYNALWFIDESFLVARSSG